MRSLPGKLVSEWVTWRLWWRKLHRHLRDWCLSRCTASPTFNPIWNIAGCYLGIRYLFQSLFASRSKCRWCQCCPPSVGLCLVTACADYERPHASWCLKDICAEILPHYVLQFYYYIWEAIFSSRDLKKRVNRNRIHETYTNVGHECKGSETSHLCCKEGFNWRYSSANVVYVCIICLNESCDPTSESEMTKILFNILLSGTAICCIQSMLFHYRKHELQRIWRLFVNYEVTFTSTTKLPFFFTPAEFCLNFSAVSGSNTLSIVEKKVPLRKVPLHRYVPGICKTI